MAPPAHPTNLTTNAPSSPQPQLRDLSERQLKLLALMHNGFTAAALARLEGIEADYFESVEAAGLMPYLELYRQHYGLPLVVG